MFLSIVGSEIKNVNMDIRYLYILIYILISILIGREIPEKEERNIVIVQLIQD